MVAASKPLRRLKDLVCRIRLNGRNISANAFSSKTFGPHHSSRLGGGGHVRRWATQWPSHRKAVSDAGELRGLVERACVLCACYDFRIPLHLQRFGHSTSMWPIRATVAHNLGFISVPSVDADAPAATTTAASAAAARLVKVRQSRRVGSGFLGAFLAGNGLIISGAPKVSASKRMCQ